MRLWGIAGLVAVCAAVTGCGGDTTSLVNVVNDTRRTVTLYECMNDDCGKPGFPMKIVDPQYTGSGAVRPRGKYWFNMSSRGVGQVIQVRDSSDRIVGCLPFMVPDDASFRISAKVSHLVRCPTSTLDDDEFWPPRSEWKSGRGDEE